MHMNYSQIMSHPIPLCLKKWGGVMIPQLLWERRPCGLRLRRLVLHDCTKVVYPSKDGDQPRH